MATLQQPQILLLPRLLVAELSAALQVGMHTAPDNTVTVSCIVSEGRFCWS